MAPPFGGWGVRQKKITKFQGSQKRFTIKKGFKINKNERIFT